mgnify:CR=1 FL=1
MPASGNDFIAYNKVPIKPEVKQGHVYNITDVDLWSPGQNYP